MSDREQLDRIERKVDALAAQIGVLIEALAQDDEDDGPRMDLSGNPIPARDRSVTTL